MEFDLKRIARAILESFGEKSQNIPNTLEGMRAILKEKISGQKYFVMLDDLWEEDGGKLEELRGLLRGGIKGSTIVVTTRSENVAVQIHATQSHKLKVLSDDHCWNLFSSRAFTSESEKNEKELVRIGKETVKKCGGIPLAAKALGYTMRLKKGVEAWLAVRNSNIWKLKEQHGSSSKTNMLPSLKLSYYFMPSYLKLCFGYCSIFPKGRVIGKNELLQQWIALGLIQPTEGLSLEKRGEGYINDLLGMSFLHLYFGFSENAFLMHDLVHDLARSIIGDELLVLDAEKDGSYPIAGNNYRYALFLNFRDIPKLPQKLSSKIRAIIFYNLSSQKMQFPLNVVLHANCLRVLHFHNYCFSNFPNFIVKLKQLRYLYASDAELQVLPESFGNLINLRYLNISYNRFKKLVKLFGNLTNLQVLILDYCGELEFLPEILYLMNLKDLSLRYCKNLRKLPSSIGNLTNLWVLDISHCQSLSITPSFIGIIDSLYELNMKGSQYPLSLSNLHGLTTNFFLVREGTSCLYDIIDLNTMGALTTSGCLLEISGLENVINPEDVSKASLCTKPKLEEIKLKWAYPESRSLENTAQDEAILKNLMPNRALKKLTLDGYSAPKFPSWLMNIGDFVPNLFLLDLENMETCEHLPPLGWLPNLSNLQLRNMPNLKKIDEAFLGGQGAFRRLEVLVLESLLELEEWPTKLPISGDDSVFTNLFYLEVNNCPNLRFEPSIPGSKICRIQKSPHILSLGATNRCITSLRLIDNLTIELYQLEIETLPDIIRGMAPLKRLEIRSCNNLTEMPEWLEELTSLERIKISCCESLNSFPLSLLELPSMKSIHIWGGNQELVEWCSQDNRFDITKVSVDEDYSIIRFNHMRGK